MTTPLLFAGMALVVAGFLALAVTDAPVRRAAHPGWRRGAVVVWLLIVAAGWAVFGYLAVALPGGLETAWRWVSAQPGAMRAAMWAFLLPWTGALWIAGRPWSDTLTTVLVIGLAALTFGLGVSLFRSRSAA